MQALLDKIAVTMTPDITTEYNAGRYVDLEIELADGSDRARTLRTAARLLGRGADFGGRAPCEGAGLPDRLAVRPRQSMSASRSAAASSILDADGVRRLLSLACGEAPTRC